MSLCYISVADPTAQDVPLPLPMSLQLLCHRVSIVTDVQELRKCLVCWVLVGFFHPVGLLAADGHSAAQFAPHGKALFTTQWIKTHLFELLSKYYVEKVLHSLRISGSELQLGPQWCHLKRRFYV